MAIDKNITGEIFMLYGVKTTNYGQAFLVQNTMLKFGKEQLNFRVLTGTLYVCIHIIYITLRDEFSEWNT